MNRIITNMDAGEYHAQNSAPIKTDMASLWLGHADVLEMEIVQ